MACAKAAVGLIVPPNFLNDARIARFCAGLRNLRPPAPKYDRTWNPDQVLEYIRRLPNNLSFLELSQKLATLLALATAHQIQTLSAIQLSDIHQYETRVEILVSAHFKSARFGGPNPTLILPFFSDPAICPAQTLLHFIQVSASRRGTISNLFITSNSPHRPASTTSDNNSEVVERDFVEKWN